MQHSSETIDILLARFGGKVLIPFIPAAESVGIKGQTARNKLVSGKFPIPTVLEGSRRFIHVGELARYVDHLRAQSLPKTKRGRPTKASKFQAR